MAYQVLSPTTPEVLVDRVNAIETDLQTKESVSLMGTHFYAGGYVPASFTAGSDTAGSSTVLFVSELRIHGNVLITGISFLIGTVGGTNTCIVALYNSSGALVANSSLTGPPTVGTDETFQRVPFTSTYQAAPGLYYVAVSYSGNTAKLCLQTAGDHNCGSISGQVYATLPNPITVPTTFTTATGPICMSY